MTIATTTDAPTSTNHTAASTSCSSDSASLSASPPPSSKRIGIIFDYDWSLINTNSDTWIFEQCFANDNPNLLMDLALGRLPLSSSSNETNGESGETAPTSDTDGDNKDNNDNDTDNDDVENDGGGTGMQWTKAVDRGLQIVQETKFSSSMNEDEIIQELCDAVANVPVQDEMLDLVRYASSVADLHIVSDANTVFIEEFLNKHNIKHHFKHVVTNYGEIVNEASGRDDQQQQQNQLSRRLRVRPYYDFDNLPPHGCPWCPPNMCKGRIVSDVIKVFENYDNIIYVGDGGGDFCPCRLLREKQDLVLARLDPSDSTKYGLVQRIQKHPTESEAKLQTWNTGHDVNQIICNYIASCSKIQKI